MLLYKGNKICPYSIFYAVKIEQQRQPTKIQLELARKRCRSRTANLALKICSIVPCLNIDKLVSDLSLMRLGNKKTKKKKKAKLSNTFFFEIKIFPNS